MAFVANTVACLLPVSILFLTCAPFVSALFHKSLFFFFLLLKLNCHNPGCGSTVRETLCMLLPTVFRNNLLSSVWGLRGSIHGAKGSKDVARTTMCVEPYSSLLHSRVPRFSGLFKQNTGKSDENINCKTSKFFPIKIYLYILHTHIQVLSHPVYKPQYGGSQTFTV